MSTSLSLSIPLTWNRGPREGVSATVKIPTRVATRATAEGYSAVHFSSFVVTRDGFLWIFFDPLDPLGPTLELSSSDDYPGELDWS